MTQDKPHTGDEATPATDEPRAQVEATREELGETVEALAAKADVKTRAEEKTAQAQAQLRDKASHVVHVVQDKTPEPVREKAGQGLQAARANRAPLLAAAGALIALLLIRRSRKHR
ncbi:DUF3618 domain-containing protein [Streptomyces sp. N50]|uniref:DUF3618 domain-containing protein n=1 Tax=Streptomyces sp. N50 TaxID=3081765 RepID=UPI0029621565|nr:DUF3618 domain-containing protein [Streptomyces sp. N50]WOX07384.1 DUF3618 domain-containing protein [Streptomyces sp. N50]